ncbi:hypothetical protein BpHYR1_008135 [Brachionus plicatilis]|uniref:Uncharacterized protein n=1 Tax=Brachionus plicatilis TaxID=10195 RepID=A0A3M7QX67_BRAPC|nr:hypothetical protein BpHYR1_008135 [Brachionus plicatilis]
MAQGIGPVLEKNIIENHENELEDDFLYEKSENRVSNDIFTDTVAALNICRKMCYSSNDITGYVQEISAFPYSFLLLNELQMRIWEKIQHSNPVWCFDATSSVLKEQKGQNSPFLFTIAMHDKKNTTILPILDFVSTSHESSKLSQD